MPCAKAVVGVGRWFGWLGRKMNVTGMIELAMGRLDEVWGEIGLTREERAEQLQFLFRQTEELYSNRLSTEQALAAAYATEVDKLRRDIELAMDRLDLVRLPETEAELVGLPLVKQLAKLRADFDQLAAKRDRMETVLNAALHQVHALCAEMKCEVPVGFETNDKLTAERERELEQQLDVLLEEKQARTAYIDGFVRQAAALLALLEMDVVTTQTTQLDHMILKHGSGEEEGRGFLLDVKSIRRLECRVQELDKERALRETICRNLAKQIQLAFDGINQSSQAFFAQYPPNGGRLGEAIIYAYELQLQHLQQERKLRIAEVIEHARDGVRVVLEESRPSLMERSRITALLSEPVCPNNLEQCEHMLARYQLEKDKLAKSALRIQPVVQLCQKYIALCRERDEYECLIQDSSRLLNRSRRSGVTLQEEERMRKRVAEMPKFLHHLRQQVLEFERGNGGAELLVLDDLFGEDLPVLQVIEQNERDHQDRLVKEKEQRARNKLGGGNVRPSITATTGARATGSCGSAPVKRIPLAHRQPKSSTG